MDTVIAENTNHFCTISYLFHDFRKRTAPKALQERPARFDLKEKKKKEKKKLKGRENFYIMKDTKIVGKMGKGHQKVSIEEKSLIKIFF